MSGDFEGAIREAKLALALKPNPNTAADSHATIARALERLNRPRQAAEEFDNAVGVYKEALRANQSEPLTHASTYVALGNLLFDLHRFEEAEAAYRLAIQHDPKISRTLLALANTLQNQGEKDEALRYYREYLPFSYNAEDKQWVEGRIKFLEATPPSALLGYVLLDAAEQGYLSSARLLLSKGAEVNIRWQYKSPLTVAATQGHLEMVELLLAHGAKDDDGAAITGAYEAGHDQVEKTLQRAAIPPLNAKVLDRILDAAIRKGDVSKFAAVFEANPNQDANALLVQLVSQTKAPPEAMVRLTLEKGANVNQPSRYKTVLMYAASEGHAAIAKLLLAKGAEVNAQTDEGTPLMMAVLAGHAELVKILLAAGADVNAKHRTGDSVLMMAARAGGRLPDSDGGSPALNSEVLQMLLDQGANPDLRGQWERTALMYANSADKVRNLLARGADIEAKDHEGQTALMKAALAGHADVTDALIRNNANLNSVDKKGGTALIYALRHDDTRYGDGAQKLASGRLEVARRLLREKYVDVNIQNEHGETALMRAVSLGVTDIVNSLLAQGADPNLADVLDRTAFVIAYEKDNTDITSLLETASTPSQSPQSLNAYLAAAISRKDEVKVKELLAAGANANYEYSIGYSHRDIRTTVLVQAAKTGSAEIVKLLLERGADPGAKGLVYGSERGLKFGTALEAAEFSQHSEVVELLRKASKSQP